VNAKSGLAMDMTAASTANGTNIIQFTSSGAANQLWSVTPTGDGYYKFSPTINAAASLAIAGGSNAESATVQEYAWANLPEQQWSIKPHKDNLVTGN
jgi:Ricin-type beta-trefoil lectin domain-like